MKYILKQERTEIQKTSQKSWNIYWLQCILTSWVSWERGGNIFRVCPRPVCSEYQWHQNLWFSAPIFGDHAMKCDGAYFQTTIGDKVLHKIQQKGSSVRKDIVVFWLLHPNNEPSHTSLWVPGKAQYGNAATATLHYQSSPNQLIFIPEVENPFKGCHFDSTESI